jgi:uncharacterized protein (TIGR00730 family)
MKKIIFFVLTFWLYSCFAQQQTIAVFCSADNKVSDSFKTIAHNLGALLGQHGFGLVTGGSQTGLMKEIVDGYVHATDSLHNLFGIMPDALKPFDVHHKKIPENQLLWVQTMHCRLTNFQNISDAIIILPGGYGTLHELMDFLVHSQFELIKKIPIIICNIDGYWDNLLQQFKVMEEHKLLHPKHLALITVANSEQECLDILINLSQSSSTHECGLNSFYWEKNKQNVLFP